jgi:hypothetical protein
MRRRYHDVDVEKNGGTFERVQLFGKLFDAFRFERRAFAFPTAQTFDVGIVETRKRMPTCVIFVQRTRGS